MIINYDPFPVFHTPLAEAYLPKKKYVDREVKEGRTTKRKREKQNKKP